MEKGFKLKCVSVVIAAEMLLLLAACHRQPAPAPLRQIAGRWNMLNSPPASVNSLLVTTTGFLGISDSGTGWYSGNEGNTWNPVTPSPTANQLTAQVDLMNNANVFVYSRADGTFYKSGDGGRTWNVLNHLAQPLPVLPNYALTTNTADSFGTDVSTQVAVNAFWGASNGRLFLLRYDSVFTVVQNCGLFTALPGGVAYNFTLLKSDNNGNSWDSLLNGLSRPVQLLSIGNTLLLLTSGQVWRSADNGSTWNEVNPYCGVVYVCGQLFNQSLAGIDGLSNIYLSPDTGKTWNLFYAANTGNSLVINFDGLIAFDSIIAGRASALSAYHMVCTGTQHPDWFGADAGVSGAANFGQNATFYLFNRNVYVLFSGGGFYSRPRTDFKGL